MKLHITGVSHKTAPVEVRECLAFRPETLPGALADLKARQGVVEAVILSTCNRVEITLTSDDRSDPQAIVDSFLADQKAIPPLKVAVDPALPAIFGLQPLPFLLPLTAPIDNWAKDHDGNYFAATQSNQLAKFQSRRKASVF